MNDDDIQLEEITTEVDLTAVNTDLAALLNKHGLDSLFGIPDFVLSRFMLQVLAPFSEAVQLDSMFRFSPLDDEDGE